MLRGKINKVAIFTHMSQDCVPGVPTKIALGGRKRAAFPREAARTTGQRARGKENLSSARACGFGGTIFP